MRHEELFARRLITFSRIYLVIFAIALVAFVNRTDANALQKDIDSLDLIEQVNAVSVSAHPDGIIFYAIGDRIRGDVRNWLLSQGSEVSQQFNVVREHTSGLIDPNDLVHVEIEQDTLIAEPRYQNVDQAVRAFKTQTMNRTLSVATEISPDGLQQIEDYKLAKDECEETHYNNASQVPDENNNMVLFSFRAEDCLPNISLEIISQEIVGPSIYTLAQDGPFAGNPVVQALAEDSDQLRRLEEVYGSVKPEVAMGIARDEFVTATGAVTVFGFAFTPRRFPLAIVFLHLLASWVIFLTVSTAKHQGYKAITGVADADVVDMIIASKIIRTLLWVVIPVLSATVALPSFPLTHIELYLIYGGTGVVLILGCLSALLSRSL